jgi:hypothetical protein
MVKKKKFKSEIMHRYVSSCSAALSMKHLMKKRKEN